VRRDDHRAHFRPGEQPGERHCRRRRLARRHRFHGVQRPQFWSWRHAQDSFHASSRVPGGGGCPCGTFRRRNPRARDSRPSRPAKTRAPRDQLPLGVARDEGSTAAGFPRSARAGACRPPRSDSVSRYPCSWSNRPYRTFPTGPIVDARSSLDRNGPVLHVHLVQSMKSVRSRRSDCSQFRGCSRARGRTGWGAPQTCCCPLEPALGRERDSGPFPLHPLPEELLAAASL